MKKLFFIALFTIGLTSTVQAQLYYANTCVDQTDAPGSTGGTGFLSPFTFGSDTLDIAVSTSYLNYDIDGYVSGSLTDMGTDFSNSEQYYWAEVYYNGYNYYIDVTTSVATGKILYYSICR